ncbi:MAG TPA: sensor histidine kinase N-terminal domain-containing protein [Noviherbaspirillum sp.]|jgi:two-component system sensor histidine kinase TctE|uniref:sensor histidine kinase n=1 Tax=Noviherbaspirillum sp. TaxID=1926288 RepID=UPI002DDCCADA|nr:sensor histidine kinase N-terminal domain-containing protein [Noviherbaspirillum sp.]HEV2611108.1 sensor histidine kinase N-terminal domain-containing protein [Noviherbaspirillum sp.]
MSDGDSMQATVPVASDAGTLADPFGPAEQELEEQIQRSLFGEILDWMLVPLLLLWPMSIAITYLVAKSIANYPFDHALDDTVTVLAQQVKEVNGKVVALLPNTSRDLLRADDVDNIYFQIIGTRGEYVDGDRDMPMPPPDEEKPLPGSVIFRNDVMRGNDVRIAYTYIDMKPRNGGKGATESDLALVQVGETLDKRVEHANEIIKGVILPQFIILPIALALVWFALSRGLSPLAELQRHIRERRPDDLSPIDSRQVPEEISPLVSSLNDMLERLSQTIHMQKRFIADAAHQMKTPLAGMRMQSELALRQTNYDEVHRSLEQLSKSSESATRLVNQLLALARAENQTPEAKPFVPLELSELARNVVQDWVQASFTHRIDLGFEQPGYPVMVLGNPITLRELLSNLIDNALRYTPAGGSVTVRVGAGEGGGIATLEVEDTGPGIPYAERTHVFERFYRILGNQAEGSGLGLSIVREIAQQHGATVDIFNNPRSHDPKFPGSLFRVTLRGEQRLDVIEDIG